MEHITYYIDWSPDSRFTYGHWIVRKSYHIALESPAYMHSRSTYTFSSDAILHAVSLRKKYPNNIHIKFPSVELKERARQYYGRVLEDIMNNDGLFIGC